MNIFTNAAGAQLGRRVRIGASLGALAVVLVGTAGCAASGGTADVTPSSAAVTEQELLDAALKGPALQIYGSVNQTSMDNMITAFKAEYNIDIVYTRLTTGPMEQRYSAEATGGNVQADLLFNGDPSYFNEGDSAKWFQALDANNIPNAKDLPKQYFYGNSIGVGVQRLDGVITNSTTTTTANIPTTWKSITDAKYTGKVAALDPRPIPVAMSVWEALDKKYGDAFLQAVAKQGVQWTASGTPGAQAVVAGEKLAFYGGSQGFTAPILQTAPKAPLNPIRIFDDLHIGYIWNAAISKTSGNPAAAKLFVSWMLTPQGQRLLGEPSLQPSVLPDVTIKGAQAPEADFVVILDDVPAAEATRITQLLGLQ